jgi:hypothetical protein
VKRLRGKLTYANVVSTLCLVVLLDGGVYAATKLPANSVGTKQLKNGAVTRAKIKEGSDHWGKGQPCLAGHCPEFKPRRNGF